MNEIQRLFFGLKGRVSSSNGTMYGPDVEKLRDGSNFWASWQFCMKHKDEQTKYGMGWGHLERHYRYQEELVRRPGGRKEQGMDEWLGLCVETGACKPRLNNLGFLLE